MAFTSLYSASLTQTGSAPITASTNAKDTTISGTWTYSSPGKYIFSSSIRLLPDSMVSGSVSGSLVVGYAYSPTFSNSDTASIFVYQSSSLRHIVVTTVTGNASSSLANNLIKGNLQFVIGIDS
jgi:hypothetical protein